MKDQDAQPVEAYEKPDFEIVDMEQAIRGIGGSNPDGDSTPTSFL